VTTNVGPGSPSEGRRWSHVVGPRWLLRGDVGFTNTYEDDPLGMCMEIDGLFVDLPPRPRERFTLIGATPAGALADLLDGLPESGGAWLGDVGVRAPEPPPDVPPVWWGEDLADVVVLAQRPSETVPGTVDIDLDGFVLVDDRTDAVVRPENVTEFVLVGRGDKPYGSCRDVTGVFRELAAPPVPKVRLFGCQPAAPLSAVLGAASQQGRRIRAEVYAVAADGSAFRVIDAVVDGTITASEPSRLGAGLFDVTVDSLPREPLPTGVLGVLERWHTGRPAGKNSWAGYDRELRHRWAGMALIHRTDAPDRPAGTTYDLDGQFVTDIEGFYCALGEAINGPGGYFGWNLDALDECLRGAYGAWPPFRLVWHDSAVAREHLVPGYDEHRLAPAIPLEYLLDMFEEHQIEVDLR
jgi:hypothetical protein